MAMTNQVSLATRAAIHAALGDSHRLAIVDILSMSDKSPFEIGKLLGMETNLLAHHLGLLERAGVIRRTTSSGDKRRRYLQLNEIALTALMPPGPLSVRRVLFICAQNSARSLLAAAHFTRATGAEAESAGTQPAARVHPLAVRVAARHGLDISKATPKSLDDIDFEPDLVVTVCDQANEELPETFARFHWSIPDPAAANTASAFEAAYQAIERRIVTLAPVGD